MNQFSWKTKTIFHLYIISYHIISYHIISYHIISYRPVASIKWLGGLSEWPTLTPRPPASVPRLKHTSWYMWDHYICLQYLLFLSLIFRLCWLWRNRELVWDIVRGKFANNCFRVILWFGLFLRLHHDKSVPCLFSTCLDFFVGGCCEDIVKLSI